MIIPTTNTRLALDANGRRKHAALFNGTRNERKIWPANHQDKAIVCGIRVTLYGFDWRVIFLHFTRSNCLRWPANKVIHEVWGLPNPQHSTLFDGNSCWLHVRILFLLCWWHCVHIRIDRYAELMRRIEMWSSEKNGLSEKSHTQQKITVEHNRGLNP